MALRCGISRARQELQEHFDSDALYKTIRQTDQNVPLQFTAVWTCNDIFDVKGLNFDGFADF